MGDGRWLVSEHHASDGGFYKFKLLGYYASRVRSLSARVPPSVPLCPQVRACDHGCPQMPPLFPFLSPLCLGSVLSRHDRDPKVSTHIRIAAVLWDETIKSLCVCVYLSTAILM